MCGLTARDSKVVQEKMIAGLRFRLCTMYVDNDFPLVKFWIFAYKLTVLSLKAFFIHPGFSFSLIPVLTVWFHDVFWDINLAVLSGLYIHSACQEPSGLDLLLCIACDVTIFVNW